MIKLKKIKLKKQIKIINNKVKKKLIKKTIRIIKNLMKIIKHKIKFKVKIYMIKKI